MKKILYISVVSLLLQSCSLFVTIPEAVLNAQRAAYQSVLIGEANCLKIIDEYVERSKKLVAYHENYIMQLDIDDTNKREAPEPTKMKWIESAERQRDKKLKKSYSLIDARAKKMREMVKQHYTISLRLIGSVYNYMSTNPIEIDNLEFWIKKLDEVSKDE